MFTCVLLLLFAVCEARSSKFTYGPEADKLCVAYKKICPRSKVCAIQTIQWPRPMKFPVCVHEFAVQVRSRVCTQAPSPGQCEAQFRRWYYNVHQAACSWFTYGGCGGNGNNFRSKEECEKVCIDGRGDEEDDEGPTTLQPQTTRIVRFRGNQDADRYGGDVSGQHHNSRSYEHYSSSYARRHPSRSKTDPDYPDARVRTRLSSRAEGRSSLYAAAGHERGSTLDGRTSMDGRTSVVFDENDLSRRERKNPSVTYSDVGRHGNSHRGHDRRVDSAAERLTGVAVQAPSIPKVHIHHRRVGNTRRRFSLDTPGMQQPVSRPRVPYLLQPPVRASELSDVASGLTSVLESGYAAEANETIRRFPSTGRRRRRGRGKGRKKNRRRRRKGRKGKKGKRRNRMRPAVPRLSSTSAQHTNRGLPANTTGSEDHDMNSTTDAAAYTANQWNDAPRRVMEFRRRKTSFWPEKTQSDEADQKILQETIELARKQLPEDKKSRRRRRRRRGRKGRKKQRGERRRAKGDNTAPRRFNRYYDRIRLFGLLEKAGNGTDTAT